MVIESLTRNGPFRYASRLERKIIQRTGSAIGDFKLIEQDDHILVAVSGGKDSLAMLEILKILQRRSPITFFLKVLTIRSGTDTLVTDRLEAFYRKKGYDYQMLEVPIDQIIKEKLEPGVIPCSLCSRIRRGALYTIAPQLGCNKIALGHNLDDLLETLLLNLFFGGQLRSMAPLLTSDDGLNQVIRPLCYVPEAWLREYSKQQEFPVSTCTDLGCPTGNSRRQQMKELINELDLKYPRVRWNMLRALRNVRTEHLLDLNLISADNL